MNQDYKQNYVSLYGKSDDEDADIHANNLSLVDKLNHNTKNKADPSPSPINNSNSNVTPNILLEQLAYVDNFLPNLNHDFIDLNNWIFNNNNNNSSSSHELSHNNPLILDEQLAAELSAFADDVFIFPDEDKQKLNNNNNNNEENTPQNNNNNKKKNSHYLSQRRNTFLTSQYDYSKSRFSSRRDNNNPASTNIEVSTFSPDVDSSMVMMNNNTNARIDSHNVASISNLNNKNSSSALPRLSQIQIPDYSKISTQSLVALLPRVTVPTPVNDLLISSGFSNDQIVSLSAIMAYHQQQMENNTAAKDYDKVTLQSRLDQLNDANPVKAASTMLLQLLEKLESQDNKHGSNGKNTSKDEILSLIEASNKEVNELKAKLDKKIVRTQRLKEEMKNMIQEGVSEQRLDGNHVYNSSAAPPTESFKDNGVYQKNHNEKHQDEKSLEGTIQQLTSLTNSLQNRIQSLESENELLKELLIRFTGEIGGAERMESIKQQFLRRFPKD